MEQGLVSQRTVTPQQTPPLRRGRQAQTKCSANRGRVCSMRFFTRPRIVPRYTCTLRPRRKGGVNHQTHTKSPLWLPPTKNSRFFGTRGGELSRPTGATTTPRRFRRTPSVTTHKKLAFFAGPGLRRGLSPHFCGMTIIWNMVRKAKFPML